MAKVTESMLILLALIVLGGTAFLANRQQQRGEAESLLPYLLYLLIGATVYLGFNVMSLSFINPELLPETAAPVPEVNALVGFSFFVFSGLIALLSFYLMRNPAVRLRLKLLLGENTTYNPDSIVHTTAVIMALVTIVFMLSTFVIGGGIEGFAENLAENQGNTAILDLVLTLGIFLVIAVIGVGYPVRRTLPETLDRLAVTRPTTQDWRWGIGAAIFLYFLQITLGAIWFVVVSPEVFEAQTAAADQIFAAYSGSLWAGFLLAFTAAVGEEVLFRGALQPVFGIPATSAFFVLLHLQYSFTPAALIILVVAVGLAWLRQRFNTTTAIIAHFVYNFTPFLLIAFAGNGTQ